MLGGALPAIGFVVAVTQVVVGVVISLIESAPAYLATLSDRLEDTFGIQAGFDTVIDQLAVDRERLAALAGDAVGGVLGPATTALGTSECGRGPERAAHLCRPADQVGDRAEVAAA
jgi:hypothetical protein